MMHARQNQMRNNACMIRSSMRVDKSY